ncbi:hypothetical protein EYY60_01845 [Flavobacterium zhairuonense]|uniref:hypothetical protein n=1 Tax=Flavobacterium zhairuonense TaxID=2493631 RepID=UPI001043B58A|nr:hypothetical protein [Flavobacterium zhairuonense]KAF2515887.1 hypothetical protein EYY60_01845 [Flavobacterium zhairuonense]
MTKEEIVALKIIELEKSIFYIKSPAEGVNMVYNLILLKGTLQDKSDLYPLSKKFFKYYIEVIKSSNYGYDTFNFTKIENVLNQMDLKLQISILQFVISNMTKELPEYDKDWFVCQKNKIQLRDLVCNLEIKNFFKIIALFSGLNFATLLFTLSLVFILVFLILLPTKIECCQLFEIKYDNYSSNFYGNHFLNILTLFADFDNDFKIKPLSWFATILMVMAKITFITIIVNFLYVKLTDKLTS